MLGENIKLLFKLYYRPVSAMSDIIDRGSWLFELRWSRRRRSCCFHGDQSHIHNLRVRLRHAGRTSGGRRRPPPQEISPSDQPQTEPDEEVAEDLEQSFPVTRRLPLPIIGNVGWRLVSFTPTSLFAIALSLAALYAPAAILALTLISRTGSFSVAFRRDYGPLLICVYMAWAASHLPFALAGFALDPLKLGAEGALVLWLLGSGCFGALMIFALRMVPGDIASFKHAAVVVGIAWISLRFDSWVFSIATSSPSSR